LLLEGVGFNLDEKNRSDFGGDLDMDPGFKTYVVYSSEGISFILGGKSELSDFCCDILNNRYQLKLHTKQHNLAPANGR